MTNSGNVFDLVITAFDVETTGLNPSVDKIVELGIIKFHGKTLLEKFSVLINPGIPIPIAASKIHGITDAMVQNEKSFDQISDTIIKYFSDSVVIAHNASFDKAFLETAFRPLNGLPEYSLFDTLPLSKRAFPGLKSYSLENLVATLALEKLQSHRALDDAINCKNLFLRCLEKLSFFGHYDFEELLIQGALPFSNRYN